MFGMRNILIFLLLLVVLAELVALYKIRQPVEESPVLSATTTAAPVPSPTPTIEPVATLEPTPEATPKPTQSFTGTPTPIAAPLILFTSQEINGFIERFSSQYSVSPDILRHIAVCESGFNSGAKNLGYAGLYQFGGVTWKNLRQEIGEDPNPDLRFNAEEAVQTAAYAISKGKIGIWPNCNP